MVSPTDVLSEFAAAISIEHASKDLTYAATRAVLDAIGCAVAGGGEPVVDALAKTLIDLGETGRTPVFGRSGRFSHRAAALINGTAVHALEMDDTHSFSSVHAGGPVVSAALAAGAYAGASGADIFSGVVAGYEVACRLGIAIRGHTPYHRGFHPTGTCGVFGAAAAATRVMGLSAEKMRHAWGIAGSRAAGLMAYIQNGAWTKPIHPGWAAEAGFLSALLAENGVSGPADIFTGKYNFPAAYADAYSGDALTGALGDRFEIARMSYKKFACCRTIHAPVTAALAIRTQLEDAGPEAFQTIEVEIADDDIPLVLEPLQEKKFPETVPEARFSMPFCVAVALIAGDLSPADLTPDRLTDPMVRALSDRFSYKIRDDYTKRRPAEFPCKMTVRVDDHTLTATVNAPPGDYANPMDEAMFIEKFYSLAGPVLGAGRAEALMQAVYDVKNAAMEDAPALSLLEAGARLSQTSNRTPRRSYP